MADRLSHLPDEVLRAVFASLPHMEIARAKRVNQRLHSLLTKHRHRLPRTKVDDLTVERRWTAAHTLGRIRRVGESAVKDKRLVVFLRKKQKTKERVWDESEQECHEVEAVDTVLRDVELGDRLGFDRITFTEELADVFDRSWIELSAVTELGFTYCDFALSEERWNHFVEKLRGLEKLTLDFGRYSQEVLSDKIFSKLPKLAYVSVQPRGASLLLPAVTDSTLDSWIVSGTTPRFVNLYKTITNFTMEGVHHFVTALLARNDGQQYQLDLGRIHASNQSDVALAGLMSLPGLRIGVCDDGVERRVHLSKGNIRVAVNLEQAITLII